MAWICERAAQRSLPELYLEIVDACGPAETIYLSTDRQGTPFAGGGLHMSLRDLGRYGLLLAPGGATTLGPRVGSAAFGDATRSARRAVRAFAVAAFTATSSRPTVSGSGTTATAGSGLMVWPESEIVIACLSGIADDGGLDCGFIERLAALGEEVAAYLTRA